MNCYYHPTFTAVGVCKSCGKGLCPECAFDLGKGLACKGKCEQDVISTIELIERNIRLSPTSERLIQAARRNRYSTSTFYLVFGSFFIGIAAYQFFESGFQQVDTLLGGMGFLFLLFGLFALFRTIGLTRAIKSVESNNS